MREILFRGKRLDNGKYVEGGSIINAQDGIWIIPTGGIIQYAADSRKLVYVEAIPVVPETVGQYTGLKDQNGKKIFEGDIVELEDHYCDIKWRAAVEFGKPNGDYSWGWQLNPIEKVATNTDILCWVEAEKAGAYCKVIGNKWDNPELLKEDKQ